MSAHTPGPWVISYAGVDYSDIETEDGSWVADGVRKRDAAIISAAPDLLYALELYFSEAELQKFVATASAAIAKAKGETP